MSHSRGSKCVLTGTSTVSYGSSEQIREAGLKAKCPQAPEQLTPPRLYTSGTRQSYWFWCKVNIYQEGPTNQLSHSHPDTISDILNAL